MKLYFEPNLDYQHSAIESVCDLFRGQEICRTEFTVTRDATAAQQTLAFAQSDLGIGNRQQLLDDEILANLTNIQVRNGLRPSASLASGDFTVEMETGTGKTYVYLRTIFELNRRYGFTKFVVVVPSVAIKEGVYKTLQITEEHFRGLYANAPFEYFLYDSSKPGTVRNFATSPEIQIMIVTVGAINKKEANNLYKESEKTGGEKAIDLIKATRPIVIVYEPQSVDGGLEGQGRKALGEMNPLCTLRYSATHADKTTALGVEKSEAIWTYLKDAGHVDVRGKVQDTLRQALKDGKLQLPEEFKAQLPQVTEMLRKLAGRLDIKNADERRPVKTRQTVLQGEEFKALWDRIKHKTTYRVQFDNEKLVRDCADTIRKCPPVTKTRMQIRKADLAIGRGGVLTAETIVAAPVILEETDIELPDLLTDLQDKTQLTRRSIATILTSSGRLDDFKLNAQQFIELAAESINRTKRLALVDGIRYKRIGDEEYYAQELFQQEELTGYLKNMLDSNKSVYEQVVYDSAGVERTFAEQLEKNEAVRVYAKLPGWFKVPTPLGTYNPDWAVLVEKDGLERLYFVVETKSSLFTDDLRDRESAKIECGKAHFQALAVGTDPPEFVTARNIDDLMARC